MLFTLLGIAFVVYGLTRRGVERVTDVIIGMGLIAFGVFPIDFVISDLLVYSLILFVGLAFLLGPAIYKMVHPRHEVGR
jgi:ABC-type uncharacterized transport system permease subunit